MRVSSSFRYQGHIGNFFGVNFKVNKFRERKHLPYSYTMILIWIPSVLYNEVNILVMNTISLTKIHFLEPILIIQMNDCYVMIFLMHL